MQISRAESRGAALLALMLVLMAGSAYFLVSKFNNQQQLARHDEVTMSALQKAKEALLGYAVAFPEIDAESSGDAIDGVGYLPCPDVSNDGVAGGSCSIGGGTTIGRLPYRTLDIQNLRDGSGERLWYALSENYKGVSGKTIPMNSDEGAQLKLDGANDIAAIIIAPGKPICNQNSRSPSSDDHSQYLDGLNGDSDLEGYILNGSHMCDGVNRFNDKAVYISRTELMTLMEKRVIGEIAFAVNSYQNNHGAYPWLNPVSPFTAPEDAAYKSVPGTYVGRIPYHWQAETSTADDDAGRNPFATTLGLQWQIDNDSADINMDSGTTDPVLAPPPDEDCVRTHECDDVKLNDVVGSCTWKAVSVAPSEYASCQMEIGIDKGLFNRTYNIVFEIPHKYNDNDIELAPPSDTAPRTRTIANICYPPLTTPGDCLPVERINILVTDEYLSGESYRSIELINELIDGGMQVANIRYDLDVDSNELPEWVVRNNWHHMSMLAYAPGESLPGSVVDECTPGADCLEVEGSIGQDDNKRGIVISAGQQLPGQSRYPSDALDDYLEDDNYNEDRQFTRIGSGSPVSFNDQIKIIDEASP